MSGDTKTPGAVFVAKDNYILRAGHRFLSIYAVGSAEDIHKYAAILAEALNKKFYEGMKAVDNK